MPGGQRLSLNQVRGDRGKSKSSHACRLQWRLPPGNRQHSKDLGFIGHRPHDPEARALLEGVSLSTPQRPNLPNKRARLLFDTWWARPSVARAGGTAAAANPILPHLAGLFRPRAGSGDHRRHKFRPEPRAERPGDVWRNSGRRLPPPGRQGEQRDPAGRRRKGWSPCWRHGAASSRGSEWAVRKGKIFISAWGACALDVREHTGEILNHFPQDPFLDLRRSPWRTDPSMPKDLLIRQICRQNSLLSMDTHWPAHQPVRACSQRRHGPFLHQHGICAGTP
jgi:hypothetical protein